jgi:type IV pilus assembly protein PilE
MGLGVHACSSKAVDGLSRGCRIVPINLMLAPDRPSAHRDRLSVDAGDRRGDQLTIEPSKRRQATMAGNARGFTLIELMIVVAVVAILAAIALPNYSDYVTRSRIPDATSNLSAKRVQMEQWFQDNHTYPGATQGACIADTTSSRYFDFSCLVPGTAAVFTLQAIGKGSMAGFTYTIDQSNTKQTTAVPAGWTTSANCWVTSKGGTC